MKTIIKLVKLIGEYIDNNLEDLLVFVIILYLIWLTIINIYF